MLHRWVGSQVCCQQKRGKNATDLRLRSPLTKNKKRLRLIKKETYSFSCLVSFGEDNTRSERCKASHGSPLRTHTHGSSGEISTMNIVTKYPTSTIDKVRPQPRGGPTNHRRATLRRCSRLSQSESGTHTHVEGRRVKAIHNKLQRRTK